MEPGSYVFGAFEFVPPRRLLLLDGAPLALGSRALDILTVLVESAGSVVTNRQIMAHAWPRTNVEDGSLRVHIGALRKALGDGRDGNRFIANVPGRGYVFVAPVARGDVVQPVARGELVAPVARGDVVQPVARGELVAPVVRGDLVQPVARGAGAPGIPSTTPVSAPTADAAPRQIGNVIGRGETIAALSAQLARRRLLTITGPGGIGKTTVATAVAASVAARYPDGVWFVALAALPNADLVASAIGAAMGLTATTADPLPGLTVSLRERRTLIVLDNCEHVVEAAAVVAEALLKAAPDVSILATSREPLRAEGELVHRLTPLTVPPDGGAITLDEALGHSAVQLFLERVGASLGDVVVNDADLPTICDICRRLDGLPLALELAAVQVEAFGIQGIARGLGSRFDLLTKGRRTALRRQQTLRATMDWSHDLLTPTERIVLRRLAVFRGDFTIEAALAVVGDADLSDLDIVESIADLDFKTLIATDIGSDVTWHHLLETTRAYALEKLVESGDLGDLHRRHAAYYRDLFEPADRERETRPRDAWLGLYARHINNVRAALDWAFGPQGDPMLGVSLCAAAVPLWIQLSLLSECRQRVERALAGPDAETKTALRARMRLLAALGWSLMYSVGRAQESSTAWAGTLELAERLDDATYRRHALWGLCIDQFNNGSMRAALTFAEQFAALVGEFDKAVERMMGDRILATSLHYLGEQTRAQHHIDRALAHASAPAFGSRTVSAGFDLLVSAHYFQARILWLRGFADRALQIVMHNIEEGRLLDQPLSFCSVLGQGACPIAYLAGDLDAAERYGAMLLDHTERHSIRLWNIWARCFNGLVTARRGDLEAGTRAMREGLNQAGEARLLPRFLLLRGEHALYRGDGAIGDVDAMLAACEARDEGWYVAELMRIKAELLLARDEAGDATEALLQRSLDLARAQGALAWELRAATSLAQLRIAQRRETEAATLLRSVQARFTEGFATEDLRKAATLLSRTPGAAHR